MAKYSSEDKVMLDAARDQLSDVKDNVANVYKVIYNDKNYKVEATKLNRILNKIDEVDSLLTEEIRKGSY